MEWIAGLDLEKTANAIVILVTGLAAGMGIQRGRKATVPATGTSTVEVAGALVDSTSIAKAAGEIAGQTIAITAQTAMIAKGVEAMGQLAGEVRDLRRAVFDHKEEMQELRHEMRQRR